MQAVFDSIAKVRTKAEHLSTLFKLDLFALENPPGSGIEAECECLLQSLSGCPVQSGAPGGRLLIPALPPPSPKMMAVQPSS